LKAIELLAYTVMNRTERYKFRKLLVIYLDFYQSSLSRDMAMMAFSKGDMKSCLTVCKAVHSIDSEESINSYVLNVLRVLNENKVASV